MIPELLVILMMFSGYSIIIKESNILLHVYDESDKEKFKKSQY
jgi:hypothetical protein